MLHPFGFQHLISVFNLQYVLALVTRHSGGWAGGEGGKICVASTQDNARPIGLGYFWLGGG